MHRVKAQDRAESNFAEFSALAWEFGIDGDLAVGILKRIDPQASSSQIGRSRKARFEKAIAGLRPNERSVLAARVGGHSLAQIAKDLGFKTKSVSASISSGLAKLRRELGLQIHLRPYLRVGLHNASDDPSRKVREALRRAIRRRGIKLNQIAQRLDWSVARVSSILRTNKDLSVSAIVDICEVLGIRRLIFVFVEAEIEQSRGPVEPTLSDVLRMSLILGDGAMTRGRLREG